MYLSIYIDIDIKLNHFTLHLKLTHHCKSTTFQFFEKEKVDLQIYGYILLIIQGICYIKNLKTHSLEWLLFS